MSVVCKFLCTTSRTADVCWASQEKVFDVMGFVRIDRKNGQLAGWCL